jgi:two-component system, OmpR family, sensor kinase
MNTPPLHQRLYLRIWLAVVLAVVVLTLVAGWLGRQEAERERTQRPGREITIRNPAGEVLGQARARPNIVPGQGAEFQVAMNDGSVLLLQFSRPPRTGAGGPEGAGQGPRPQQPMRLPFDFAWMLAILAVAVAVGSYPIVRRLTKRLESVQQGVERWGQGDLSARLSEDGKDEVALLSKRFNHSAEQIETLLEAQKSLVASQQTLLASQKSLLANASHELRSPLARIRMGLELMSLDASRATLLTEITRNITELDQLIEEILLASRLDAKEADMGTVEAVDLVGLVAEECARVNADLDVRLSASADTRSARLPAPTELVVQGVSRLLRRALRNLLENARRHGAGTTSVSLEQSAGTAVIRVDDNGPGVPEAYQARIFEAFFRA